MDTDLAARLARNLRALRTARGLTQQQIAKLAELPRATWANLESGAANPTIAVLHRAALALQVPLEEILAAPRADAKHYPAGTLPVRHRGDVTVRTLLPDRVPGVVIERIELPPRARMVGTPHTPGTREYLTCESGAIDLVASGETWSLAAGDVLVFRGDQRHSYANAGTKAAVGFSVVLLCPVE
jgi:transcriptional regulator with XRE-family HTH domain